MQMVRVQLATGRSVAFPLSQAGAACETCFVLSVRKCGSSLLNSMVADLARLNGRHFVDVAGIFFESDVPEQAWRTDRAVLALLRPGLVYGGFRAMPLVFATDGLFSQARKILLVRDPRDALVSEYFSVAYTHSVPQAATGAPEAGVRARFLADREAAQRMAIADFVIQRAPELNRTMLEYQPCLADPRLRVFRYEDVILKKRQWVADICVQFGWPPPGAADLDGMMSWSDVVPEAERERAFIRRVLPGDHLEKLDGETIRTLDRILAPSMELFGYSC